LEQDGRVFNSQEGHQAGSDREGNLEHPLMNSKQNIIPNIDKRPGAAVFADLVDKTKAPGT
jgi:hypothetical protein